MRHVRWVSVSVTKTGRLWSRNSAMRSDNTSMRTLRTAAVIAIAVSAALTGCSSSSEEAKTTPSKPAVTVSAEPTAPASEEAVGEDPATWSPVIVNGDTEDVDLVVGQFAIIDRSVFPANANWETIEVTGSDKNIVMVTQANDNANATIQALAEGDATVTILEEGDMVIKTLNVKVSPASMTDSPSEMAGSASPMGSSPAAP